jgi:hypothetical protein
MSFSPWQAKTVIATPVLENAFYIQYHEIGGASMQLSRAKSACATATGLDGADNWK